MKYPIRYPIYIPTKGRWDTATTPHFLIEDNVPFWLLVEPQEAENYARVFGEKYLKILPFSNLGQGSIPARNYGWEDSIKEGYERHWSIDDNILRFRKLHKGKRIAVDSSYALRVIEDFTDRYTNIGQSGMNYHTFVGLASHTKSMPPFYLNTHLYSCILNKNDLPFRYRGRYNEDTDLNLQVLAHGLCTVAFNVICQEKIRTMIMKGGNTDVLYKGDGRLEMARSLERQWPYVVQTKRRFQRPQHVVHDQWKKFDTPLIRRTDIDWNAIENETWDLSLVQVEEVVKSDRIKKMLEEEGTKVIHNDPSLEEGIQLMNLLVTDTNLQVQHPIYIPSKARSATAMTPKTLKKEGIPFRLVVEPQDANSYRETYPDAEILVMDKNNQGIYYARNFIKQYSTSQGEKWHWQIDDNISNFAIRLNNKNVTSPANQVLSIAEKVTELYDNIGGSGIIHQAYAFAQSTQISVNRQIYTCMLLNNDVLLWFREGVVEDTDYSVQMLYQDWCTLLFTQLVMNKATTSKMAGGNTEMYESGGRYTRAKRLEELWPGKFRAVQKKGSWRIAPSRVWSEFQQRPRRHNGTQN